MSTTFEYVPTARGKALHVWWAVYWVQLVFHSAVVAANVVSFVLLPVLVPWYVAVPVCTLVAVSLTGDVNCPMTRLENRCRRALGWPPIKGFVGHYVMKPIYKRGRRLKPVRLVR